MKKLIFELLALASCFAITSCKNKDNPPVEPEKRETVDVEKDDTLDESGLGEDNFEITNE